jgi:hypothetical protein
MEVSDPVRRRRNGFESRGREPIVAKPRLGTIPKAG